VFTLEPGSFPFEVWQARTALASGVGVTLLSTLLSTLIATLAGLAIGIALSYGWWWLRGLARLYVDFMRGMPVLVLILFTYYGLGPVEVHRELMSVALRWIMAAKLVSVLSLRMATRLNSFSLPKKFSIRWRHL